MYHSNLWILVSYDAVVDDISGVEDEEEGEDEEDAGSDGNNSGSYHALLWSFDDLRFRSDFKDCPLVRLK